MLFETFNNDRTNPLCRRTENNFNKLRPMKEISCYWIFEYLDYTKYNKISVYFCHVQKHVNTNQGMNKIHNLSTESHEEIRMYE